jgi:hypothetical protein
VSGLPVIEVLCPGLKDVGEADGEASQADDGVHPDQGQRGMLQHREQETDVLLTH